MNSSLRNSPRQSYGESKFSIKFDALQQKDGLANLESDKYFKINSGSMQR